MKKLYLLSIFLPVLSFAQPTIHQSDEPVAGFAFLTGVDTTFTEPVPAGGAGVTWDFSGLLTQKYGGANFIPAAGTPYVADFPGATLADSNTTNGQWLYFRGDATGFYVCGIDTNGFSVYINPALMIVPVPFTYGNTTTHTARVQVDGTYMGTPGRLIRTYTQTFNADGWGTLYLPGDTVMNTLRIRDVDDILDSLFANILGNYIYVTSQTSQQCNFRWFRDTGPDAYLLQITADSSGATSSASEYEILNAQILVPEITRETTHVTPYPNPSSTTISIVFEKPASGTISVYNSLNQLVRTSSFTDISQYSMYVNTLENGMYHFTVTSSDNKIRQGTFVVSH